MLSGEQLLEQAAKDGAMPSEGWPRALGVVLSRLEHIVKDEFPTPTLPPSTSAERERSATPSKPPPTEGAAAGTVPSSQETTSADKENAPPPSSSGITATTKDDKINNNPSPGPSTRALSTDPVASTDAPTTTEDPVTASSLPPELHSLYTSITSVLRKQFATDPPHTIQRLAELVLCPRAHYRFLPPYLRALDRVVSVSSATSIFPLPQAVLPASTGILNGITPTTSTTASSTSSSERGLGSDESLGGALLTPIPWLQNNNSREQRSASANGNNSELVSESTEMVDGPNGTGRIETVSVINGVMTTTGAPVVTSSGASPVTATSASTPTTTADSLREAGAVTQGELLRQEQEAGVVPVGQTQPRSRGLLAGAAAAAGAGPGGAEQKEGENGAAEDEQQEEVPHARGPEEVGVEDMGPQERGPGGGIDLEAAVGRAPVGSSSAKDKETENVKEEEEEEEEEKKKKKKKKKKLEQPISPEAEMKDVEVETEEAGMKGEDLEDAKAEGEGEGKGKGGAKKEYATVEEDDEKKEAKGSDTEMTG